MFYFPVVDSTLLSNEKKFGSRKFFERRNGQEEHFDWKIKHMKEKNKRQQLTLYIANRAFGDLRKFSAIYKHRQINDFAFKNE